MAIARCPQDTHLMAVILLWRHPPRLLLKPRMYPPLDLVRGIPIIQWVEF